MQKIWGHGSHVSCLHPGSDCICGREQARWQGSGTITSTTRPVPSVRAD